VPTTSLGARYLSVRDPNSWKNIAEIVEHLISACYAAGTRSLSIDTPSVVPVIWCGIEQIYTALLSNSTTDKNTYHQSYKISRSIEFYSNDNSCILSISPSNTLDISIERKNDPEIGTDAVLSIKDVYSYIRDNTTARKARPIARLKNPIVHGLQKWIQLLWWNGITRDNYIFNTAHTSTTQIKEQMHPEFQNEWNEHLAHTLVADFFGELHTFFPNWIQWNITLKWKNNHFTRMELLHTLLKEIKPSI
jgi:UDP-3-O-acyl-N-acetylglucosamine deacetylase